jgi:hypothetical protein
MNFDWLTLDGVNWIGVLVAFLAAFALGWLWYSNAMFFPLWKRLGNLSDDAIRNGNMLIGFGGTAVFTFLGVLILAMLMAATGATGPAGGAVLGAIVGLVLRGGAHAIHNGFALRDPRITLIDAAADTAGLALAGAILGLFA